MSESSSMYLTSTFTGYENLLCLRRGGGVEKYSPHENLALLFLSCGGLGYRCREYNPCTHQLTLSLTWYDLTWVGLGWLELVGNHYGARQMGHVTLNVTLFLSFSFLVFPSDGHARWRSERVGPCNSCTRCEPWWRERWEKDRVSRVRLANGH